MGKDNKNNTPTPKKKTYYVVNRDKSITIVNGWAKPAGFKVYTSLSAANEQVDKMYNAQGKN